MEIKFSGDDTDVTRRVFKSMDGYAVQVNYWNRTRDGGSAWVEAHVFLRGVDVDDLQVQTWDTKSGEAKDEFTIPLADIETVEVF